MSFTLLGVYLVPILISFVSAVISIPAINVLCQGEYEKSFVTAFLKRFLCYMAAYLLLATIFILFVCSLSQLEKAQVDLHAAIMLIGG